eukprot:TRINITY_DN13024_c0_g1_i1.p1 TRINITY_DN13024_c0_g1~~TRINITY_DN13024_c0_g1_i1.p1  ORF type:complete len:459 (+),score=72.22 TRINITY_DN13024_c0_g1_i1:16-1392(+)
MSAFAVSIPATANLLSNLSDPEKKERYYTIYIIRVQSLTSEWEICRRYRDFHSLDLHLRLFFSEHVKSCKFPPKKIFGRFNTKFIEARRVQLEQYLQKIISHDDILTNRVFRSFLHIKSSKIGLSDSWRHTNCHDAYTEDGDNGVKYARAVQDHQSAQADGLSFTKDEIIIVTSFLETGWYQGYSQDGERHGYFPGTLVTFIGSANPLTLLPEELGPSPAVSPRPIKNSPKVSPKRSPVASPLVSIEKNDVPKIRPPIPPKPAVSPYGSRPSKRLSVRGDLRFHSPRDCLDVDSDSQNLKQFPLLSDLDPDVSPELSDGDGDLEERLGRDIKEWRISSSFDKNEDEQCLVVEEGRVRSTSLPSPSQMRVPSNRQSLSLSTSPCSSLEVEHSFSSEFHLEAEPSTLTSEEDGRIRLDSSATSEKRNKLLRRRALTLRRDTLGQFQPFSPFSREPKNQSE